MHDGMMAHRWREVARERDKTAHSNMNCINIKRYISSSPLPDLEIRKMWKS